MPKLIRVLHALTVLDRGGIETWLMNVIRQQHPMLQCDFYLKRSGGDYEQEARDLGSQIYYSPPCSRLQTRLDTLFCKDRFVHLKEVLVHGNYDAIHVHNSEISGDVVKAAFQAQIPVRVAHCHSTKLCRGKKSTEMVFRKFRFSMSNRHNILRYATDIVACSNDAGHFFVGKYWNSDSRCQPLFCGIPWQVFKDTHENSSRQKIRQEYHIPEDAMVIGHLGSMHTLVKNHFFVLEIFKELYHRNEKYWLFLAGDGPLRSQIADYAKKLGIDSRVIIPGVCNAAQLMVHAFDVHILPSLFEGLPIVGLEAVASGLFTVCSDTITKDFTEYFRKRVEAISLQTSPQKWADAVESAILKRISIDEGCQLINHSPFSIQASTNALHDLYHKHLQNRS